MKLKKMIKLIPILIFGILILNIFTTTTIYAETGDFYDENKPQIEKAIPEINKAGREFIKDYDYDTNKFDCGTFDFNCSYSAALFEGAIGLVKATYQGLSTVVIAPGDITLNDTFLKYKNGFKTLSNTILGLFIMWQMMRIVAARMADAEDGMIAINDKLVTVFGIAILLGVYTQFFNYVLKIQQLVVEAILQDTVSMKEVVLMILIKGVTFGYFLSLILAFVLMVFSIAFTYRFVLFGLLFIVGPVAIPTAVNDEYNYFSLWLRILINNGVTLFLQVLSFSLGFAALIKQDSFNKGSAFVLSMGFFMLALAIPSLLGQLGASSGTGRAMGQLVRYVARK